MPVIEGGNDLNRLGQQHAIAKDIARHIAAARRADRLRLNVDPKFKEMALDRKPSPLGGDAHRLVIVALRAATGEGIVEPEIEFLGNSIGGVGEGRRAFVGGDHEIGILAVADDHLIGMDDFPLGNIVGNR